jgi:RsbT co-antagonist protein rsbRD N-terminal domain
MSLGKTLSERRSAILNQWFDRTIETYPEETARFLRSKKNRFANPVGHILAQELESILEGLFQGVELNSLRPSLDNIIRIRAVQDLSASQSLVFLFLLKQVLREELENEILENGAGKELLELESRIDGLALLSFDIFMQCREKIFDLKANELNKRTIRLLKRAKLVVDDPLEAPSE